MGDPSTDSACVSIVVINTHDDSESDGMEAAQEGATIWVLASLAANDSSLIPTSLDNPVSFPIGNSDAVLLRRQVR
jgi:hypothetical protein